MSTKILELGHYVLLPKFCAIWGKMSWGILSFGAKCLGAKCLLAGKMAPQPLFVNRAFVALYVSIISPVGPILISLFVFELEAEE